MITCIKKYFESLTWNFWSILNLIHDVRLIEKFPVKFDEL
jgi:hypothetical protein